MKRQPILSLIILSLLVGMAGAWIITVGLKPSTVALTATRPLKESAYERVMRTQRIRCGYVLWTPFMNKDPNTAKLSGLFYDYVEGLGKALHLKIEWAEEMGWSDFPAALNNGRIDAMCGGGWPNSARARVIDFVHPILYQPLYAYARTEDKRFDYNIDAINDPSITIITVEGATASVVVTQDFPQAKSLQLPETTSLADEFVSLADNKADVVISSPDTADQYDRHNPGKIRRILTKMPLRVFGNSLSIAGGEDRLRRMLDTATTEMLSSGQVEKIIVEYDKAPGALLRSTPPYEIATHN